MKSIYQFIVEPKNNRRYDNIKNIGGIDFITSTSEEDVSTSNRQAIVIETPLNYCGPIEKGDTLLVHHNVFKFYNDMKGRRRSGKSFLKENIFFLDPDQFFAVPLLHLLGVNRSVDVIHDTLLATVGSDQLSIEQPQLSTGILNMGDSRPS